MVKALWIMVPGGARYATGGQPEAGLLNSPLASIRLRAAVATQEWRSRGNENLFRVPGSQDAAPDFARDGAGICVVTKYTVDAPLHHWLAACREMKRRRCPVVVDISDFPFEKPPPVPAFYEEVLQTCDAVTVNSERMAEMVARHTPKRVVVIEDAILAAPGTARFSPGERLELLWFGYPANLDYLEARFGDLADFSRERRCQLTIVTGGGEEAARWIREIPARFGNAFDTRFVPWSLEALPPALSACDLVLIPSDPADPFKAGASANRIAEALNAGRFAVASPLQSYLQFADAAWLGHDLFAGVRWALANREEALARIERGQALVQGKFAAGVVGRCWGDLFDNLVRAGSA